MELKRVGIMEGKLIFFFIKTLMALCLIVFESSESYAAIAREINASVDSEYYLQE